MNFFLFMLPARCFLVFKVSNSVMSSSRHWGNMAAILGSATGLRGNLEVIPELLCALVVLICKMGIKCFIKTTLFTCNY